MMRQQQQQHSTKKTTTTTMMPGHSIILGPNFNNNGGGGRGGDGGGDGDDGSSIGNNNRRRQLGFMKYGVIDKKQRNTKQSREHSRQLAMAFSQEQQHHPSPSISAAFAADFGNAFGEASSSSNSSSNSSDDDNDNDEDFFSIRKTNESMTSYCTTDRLQQLQQKQQNRMGGRNGSTASNSFFEQDPFAVTTTKVVESIAATPPAPVIRSIQEERRRLRERNGSNRTTATMTTNNTPTPISKNGMTMTNNMTTSNHSLNNANTMKRTNVIRQNLAPSSSDQHQPSPNHPMNYFSANEWSSSNAGGGATSHSMQQSPAATAAAASLLPSSSFSSATARPGFTTLPSNSSMQSDYATKSTTTTAPLSRQQQQHIVMVSNLPKQTDRLFATNSMGAATIASVTSSASSNGSSSGAAARRRVRQQMKMQMSSPQQQQKSPPPPPPTSVHNNVFVAVADNNPLTPTKSPQQQGYNFRRKSSNITSESSVGSSRGGGGAGGKNTDHVANYQRSNSSSLMNQNNVYNTNQQQQQGLNLSGYSSSTTTNRSSVNWANTSAHSSVSSTGGYSDSAGTRSSNDLNLFDPTNTHGFTFDAFGLDASKINREVDQAMHDLAGTHPDISIFLELDPADAWKWEDSNSRASTPVMNMTSSDNNKDDFVDGFRVTKPITPVHHHHAISIRQSPTRSEKSSLTSDSYNMGSSNQGGSSNNGKQQQNDGGVNPFKVKAGFHTSKSPRKVVRPAESHQQQSSFNTNEYLNRKQYSEGATNYTDTVLWSSKLGLESNDAIIKENDAEDRSDYDHHVSGAPQSDAGTNSSFHISSDVAVTSDVVIDLSHKFDEYQQQTKIPIEVRQGKKNNNYHNNNYQKEHNNNVNNNTGGGASSLKISEESDTAKTESTSTTQDDEKKDDDDDVYHDRNEKEDEEVDNNNRMDIQSLRSKWEKKETMSSTTNTTMMKSYDEPKSLSKEHIGRLEAKLGSELWSPEKIDHIISQQKQQQQQQQGQVHHSNQYAEENLRRRTYQQQKHTHQQHIVPQHLHSDPNHATIVSQQSGRAIICTSRYPKEVHPSKKDDEPDERPSFRTTTTAREQQQVKSPPDVIVPEARTPSPPSFMEVRERLLKSPEQAPLDGRLATGRERRLNSPEPPFERPASFIAAARELLKSPEPPDESPSSLTALRDRPIKSPEQPSSDERPTSSIAAARERLKSPEQPDEKPKSFIAARDRLKTPEPKPIYTSTKSEGGASFREANLNTALSNISAKMTSPRDARSDSGGALMPSSNENSAALFNVRLRKTIGGDTQNRNYEDISSGAKSQTPTNKRSTSNQQQFSSQAMRIAMRQQEGMRKNGNEVQLSRNRNEQESVSSSITPTAEGGTNNRNILSSKSWISPKQATAHEKSSPTRSNNQFTEAPLNVAREERYVEQQNTTSPIHVNRQDARADSEMKMQVDTNNRDQESEYKKKMTYKERRELEIQQQRLEIEMKNRQNSGSDNNTTGYDVASLIKRRVAANKGNTHQYTNPEESLSPKETQHEDISSIRTKLRPVSRNEYELPPVLSPTRNDGHMTSHYDVAGNKEQGNISNALHVNLQQPEFAYATNHRQENQLSRMGNKPIAMKAPHGMDVENIQRTVQVREMEDSTLYHDATPWKNNISTVEQPDDKKTYDEYISPRMSQKSSNLVIKEDSVENDADALKSKPHLSHLLMLQHLQEMKQEEDEKNDMVSILMNDKRKAMRSVTQMSDLDDKGMAPKGSTPKATMMMLNAFLAGRESISSTEGGTAGGKSVTEEDYNQHVSSPTHDSQFPALRDDPEYSRYFKMLSVGMPMDVIKHAMVRDGYDPSVMDGDHTKPVGIPLKDDPDYAKFFRMLSIGLPMEAVKHSMARDGLDPAVMDQDHNLPASSARKTDEKPKEVDSHRRARLHWKTLRKVTSNSLWAQIDQDDGLEGIDIDENEFQELFQEEKTAIPRSATKGALSKKRGSTVCVIDSKRANNGGIILARLKMSHDDLADAVDRIDERPLSAEQIENIIEYLPTKDERRALEAYMLEGGQDAAEKFECLCECEKFMVSMMTVKHAKRKVSALLFKLQFETCLQDIYKEADLIENACKELSNSTRLRQLLGIVLTFGNRLNTAGNGKRKAGAFTLDSLLKLNQAKAFDKKTTFLHYIVLIVRRNNEVLLHFKDDLPSVFAGEKVFWDQCVADLDEVENQLENLRKIALYQAHQNQGYRLRQKKKNHHQQDPDESLSDDELVLTLEEEVEALRATPIGLFTLNAIRLVSSLRDKVENTNKMYNFLLEYFGEEENKKQPHELFSVIVAFSREFEKAKDEAMNNEKKKLRDERKSMSISSNRTPNIKTNVGRPPTYGSPTQANMERKGRESSGMLKASNLQPNLSYLVNEYRKTSNAHVETQLLTGNSKVMQNDATESKIVTPRNADKDEDKRSVFHQVENSHGGQRAAALAGDEASDDPQMKAIYSPSHDANFSFRRTEDDDHALSVSYYQSPSAASLSQRVDTNMMMKESEQDRLPSKKVEISSAEILNKKANDSLESLQSDKRYSLPKEDVESSSQVSSSSMSAMRNKARLRRQRFGSINIPQKSSLSPSMTNTPTEDKTPPNIGTATSVTNVSSPTRRASDSTIHSPTNAKKANSDNSNMSAPVRRSVNIHTSSVNRFASALNPPVKSPARLLKNDESDNVNVHQNAISDTSLSKNSSTTASSAAIFSSAASRAAIRHKRRILEQQQRAQQQQPKSNAVT